MATFGILASNPPHAEMAFLAVLKIREKVKQLTEEGMIPPTRIGLGIHTGEVVMVISVTRHASNILSVAPRLLLHSGLNN